MMAVISLVGIMPAAFVADKLGRKWTIVPSCVGLAGALLLMAFTGRPSLVILQSTLNSKPLCHPFGHVFLVGATWV